MAVAESKQNCVTTRARTPEDLARVEGFIECEHPNDKISKFTGMLTLDADGPRGLAKESAPVDADSVFLRGCTLRSVDWMCGLVVNTGPDTKIMMSNQEPPVKDSSLTLLINQQLKWVVVLLLAGASASPSRRQLEAGTGFGRTSQLAAPSPLSSPWRSSQPMFFLTFILTFG